MFVLLFVGDDVGVCVGVDVCVGGVGVDLVLLCVCDLCGV